ncbi:MAG: geranylgeranylglycerol-phosphate geranylgeranyltransferase [Gemmatimonadetes bacterium]|nr:geranylgeranylglycerol-phosphate geranylgeranyltransferase [Gemmatimonadota bacterium]
MLSSLLELTRPINCAITAVAVALGALLAGGDIAFSAWVLAMASAALVAASGNIFNDVIDLEIDRLNRPDRPLPNGRVGRGAATVLGALAGALGAACAYWIGPVHLTLSLCVLVALVVYDRWLKGVAVVGNLVVSGAAALALPYGGLLGDAWSETLVPSIFAFCLHMAREIIKDVEDMDGDRLVGARTLPVRVGRYRSLSVAIYWLFALVVLTPLPHLLGWYGLAYMRLVILLDAACIAIMISLHRNPFRGGLSRASNGLKGLMLLGILAVYLG